MAAWRSRRAPRSATEVQDQGLQGDFTLVGADGDYVTGNFGKAQLVDGKRNDKLSVHVRRLAAKTTYTYKLQEGVCKEGAAGGTDVAGLNVQAAEDQPQGRRQLDGALEDVQAPSAA